MKRYILLPDLLLKISLIAQKDEAQVSQVKPFKRVDNFSEKVSELKK